MSASSPDSEFSLAPGTILAGKYRVARILGQGGMGVVVEARHIALDERVALKFLLPEYATHPEAAGRFLREARAAVKIKSQHVARVSDVGTLERGEPYMVMEFLEGSDLSKMLETRGPFPLVDAVDYTIQACEAIAEAHSYGIVHRDLKPANMFLTKHTDGTPLVKVLDFGISKVIEGDGVESLTRTTAAMGSALYMSPEQMQQTRSVDHRTDIYALGVALYEMLAGKQPFYADTLPQLCAEILTGMPTPLRTVRPDIPDAFADALAKAYNRDRAGRYQTIAEFVVALAPFAPERTKGPVDRICRMAGFEPPVAGAPARQSQPSGGGTQVLGEVPLVPGHYSGPSSANASAAFAAATNAGLSTTGNGSAASSKAPVVVAILAIVTLALGGGAAFYFLRGVPAVPDTTAQASGGDTGSIVVPPPVEPPIAPTAAPDTSAAAAASAAAVASASAEPAAAKLPAKPPTAPAAAKTAVPAAPPPKPPTTPTAPPAATPKAPATGPIITRD